MTAIIAFCIGLPTMVGPVEDVDDQSLTILWLFFTAPVQGVVIGFGIGSLINKRLTGSVVGLLMALRVDAAALVWALA